MYVRVVRSGCISWCRCEPRTSRRLARTLAANCRATALRSCAIDNGGRRSDDDAAEKDMLVRYQCAALQRSGEGAEEQAGTAIPSAHLAETRSGKMRKLEEEWSVGEDNRRGTSGRNIKIASRSE